METVLQLFGAFVLLGGLLVIVFAAVPALRPWLTASGEYLGIAFKLGWTIAIGLLAVSLTLFLLAAVLHWAARELGLL
jgi:hypothetical protein